MSDTTVYFLVLFCAFGFTAVGVLIGVLFAMKRIEGHVRWPKPMDVIRVDGSLRAVVSVEYPSRETALEPLGNLLARSFLVKSADGDQPVRMADALEEAGWLAPDRAAHRWLRWCSNPDTAPDLGILVDDAHAGLINEGLARLDQTPWIRNLRDELVTAARMRV